MAFNGTVEVGNVMDALYAGTDFSSLNWAEQKWVAWYVWWGNPIIATGMLSFLMHESISGVLFLGLSSTPFQQWDCTKQVLWAHLTVELPAIWLFYPMSEFVGMKTYQVPFPSLSTMSWQIFFFMFFEDLFHWAAHRALHTPILYKYIHKIHHKYSAPFGLAAEYAHPAEVMILGMGTLGGSLFLCLFTEVHFISFFIWVIIKLFQAIDAHSGYDFPWSLQHILPFWSGAEHHDFHHMAFTNNYSTSFRWWDRIFGTDDKYLVYRERVQAAKAKALSKEDFLKAEQALMDEVLAEGLKAENEVEERSSRKVKVQ
ncbi:C4-methyl sterol oxidase [Lentinula edodes]|uniref:C4-methyl sterol oxidase n=1 Tax=Lentinula edodes TaxID=5353 RepID=A0A1Q3E3U7_LENED|nr:C4-methyl sterol oxidase [Lentinula edodes]